MRASTEQSRVEEVLDEELCKDRGAVCGEGRLVAFSSSPRDAKSSIKVGSVVMFGKASKDKQVENVRKISTVDEVRDSWEERNHH